MFRESNTNPKDFYPVPSSSLAGNPKRFTGVTVYHSVTASDRTAVFDEIAENAERYRETLFELLRQPSISTQGVGVEECASQFESVVDDHGLDAKTVETSSAPIVYGERIVEESAPTVLFYGHYDVQPPGDEDLWDSPPFEPTIRDGSIYARGSGDNKGQVVTHLFAVDAVLRARDELPVNVKVLVEGEEECGSSGLREFVQRDPPELDCDLLYVADGPMHRSGRPTLIYGNRGILSAELSLERANADLHSGNFGGPVPNPANELAAVVSSLYEGDEVQIAGFRDGIDVSEAHREMAEAIPFDGDAMRSELGVSEFTVPDDRYYERLLLEPTLTINGLTSGYGGEGMKTIVPREATAKLDMRLVPDQDPDAVFERLRSHVEAENADVAVEKLGTFPPMKTPIDTPAAETVADALRDAWDDDPVEMPLLGGSLPAAYFRQSVDVPILVVPYANPDQANHSPNEHLDVACFENGIRTSAAFVERFGG